MLNPNLNLTELASEYAVDQRLRINNVLDEEVAQKLYTLLAEKVEYELAYVAGDNNLSMSMHRLAEITAEERRDLFRHLYAEASKGIGFLYGRFHLAQAKEQSSDELNFLNDFYAFLNSSDMLDAIKTITGVADVQSADAQATSYRAGHFLTRHRDDLSGQQRRAAYVFGFSQSWHPDWGGLLQFFEEDGTPRDAWMPQFNTLSLFDVKHIHSVTHIAPYAAAPRLSITGWFRADAQPV
ncbi:MAG: 2OG-Fe(II) oxygenase family protein [Gammaproteobacteria bacterium]